MVEGKTKSGFKFKINENIYKDWEFATLADTLRSGEGTMKDVNAMLIMVLGEKGFNSLKEHVKKSYGYIDVEAVKEEFAEITNATKVKN